jgi:signal transduction histidine kinase
MSRPFDALDRDALRIIRRALFALNSLEHEQAALEAQKNAEAEEMRLRHSFLESARANSMGALASAIAHELSQPLSAIANYVSACQQEFTNAGLDVPKRAQDLIGEAVAETARAGNLVQRVRDFISKGDLNLDHIDLGRAIKQGVDLALLSSELPRLQVNLLLDQTMPKILGDPVQIGQVVLNLVANSLTAMKETSAQVLTVEAKYKGDHVEVHVKDTGKGIPNGQIKYLFEPFHGSTTHGMGIGLSLCRSIVEAHGGHIRAEPLEQGALFVFQLPVQRRDDDDNR